MIQYDKDGVTLLDGDGKRVTIYEQPRYNDLEVILGDQKAADYDNFHAADLYTNALANAQLSVNAGRPADAPQKPLKRIVSDTGASSYVPFSPPLPDLVPLPPSDPGGKIAVVTVDPNAVMRSQINAIFKKMFGV